MKLRPSLPLSTKIARDDLSKAASSGFALAAVDILTDTDRAEHLAAIMIRGVSEEEAKKRQVEIVRRVNAYDALAKSHADLQRELRFMILNWKREHHVGETSSDLTMAESVLAESEKL